MPRKYRSKKIVVIKKSVKNSRRGRPRRRAPRAQPQRYNASDVPQEAADFESWSEGRKAALSVMYPERVPGVRVPSSEPTATATTQTKTRFTVGMPANGAKFSQSVLISLAANNRANYANAYASGVPTALTDVKDSAYSQFTANFLYQRCVSLSVTFRVVTPALNASIRWASANIALPAAANRTLSTVASAPNSFNGLLTGSKPAGRAVLIKGSTGDDLFVVPNYTANYPDTVIQLEFEANTNQEIDFEITANMEAVCAIQSQALIATRPNTAGEQDYNRA